ncbi:MAG: Tim44 domain-containing protein [Rhodocyclaceae bacterium]|nr:Tim44 domain-containing protein [Rhodocyclaceae bacterium]
MTRFLVALFACLMTFGFVAEDAEARRFGGGRSFGMQRSAPAPKQVTPANTQRDAAAAAQPRRNGWLGPIAGLAAGLGLAALFSHLGLGEEMATFFMIALLAFGALWLFRRLSRPTQTSRSPLQYANAGAAQHASTPPTPASPAGTAAGHDLEAGFDKAGFVRQAKLNFIRLQAAYDIGNLDDIRAFTTPEVFAEVKMQYDERAGADQKTDVVDLDGEVLEVARDGERYVVSVRFSGLIREVADAPPVAFDEVWHMTKPLDGNAGWLVSGIQQAH